MRREGEGRERQRERERERERERDKSSFSILRFLKPIIITMTDDCTGYPLLSNNVSDSCVVLAY